MMMAFRVSPLSNLLGGEVVGFDCRQPPDATTLQPILDALFRYQVLVFRDQDLTPEQQIAFSEAFGPLEMHVNQESHGYERPNFHVVTNLGPDGQIMAMPPPDKAFNGTRTWHSDKSYMPSPSMATFLYGVEVTKYGGETMFASLTAAYDALDDATKQRLGSLQCVHSWAQSMRNSGSRAATAEECAMSPPVTHPLIRTHSGNGRKSLYIGMHASHIDGVDESAGRAELLELLDYATQDRFVFAHNWCKGDLVVWDNASLVHKSAPFDWKTERRHLHRTVVRGDTPI
jgi:alpha-ketoglutarate-dependent taurine dioxygenase